MRLCSSECLPWDGAMRTELQLEARRPGSEREVGACRSQPDRASDQAIAFAGVKGAFFRGQRKVRYNFNGFYLLI